MDTTYLKVYPFKEPLPRVDAKSPFRPWAGFEPMDFGIFRPQSARCSTAPRRFSAIIEQYMGLNNGFISKQCQ